MPRSIYESIYRDLKLKIEDGTYEYQEMLPSEHSLIQVYDCSRNTVRRAIAQPWFPTDMSRPFRARESAAFSAP